MTAPTWYGMRCLILESMAQLSANMREEYRWSPNLLIMTNRQSHIVQSCTLPDLSAFEPTMVHSSGTCQGIRVPQAAS